MKFSGKCWDFQIFSYLPTQRGKLNWSLQRQLEDLSRQKQQSWRRRPTTLLVQIFQRKESKTKEVIIIIAAFHVFDFNHGNEQFQIETSTFQKKMKKQNLWTETKWQMNQSFFEIRQCSFRSFENEDAWASFMFEIVTSCYLFCS